MRRILLAAVALAAGCSDALEQTSSAGQVIAVVNSDHTVSFIAATDLSVRTVDLQTGGFGMTAAGRGSTVVVPLGSVDSVAVIHNAGLCTGLCVRPVVLFPLSPQSGATGVAIQDDSIAWIANPKLNTVTRVNYLTGDTASNGVGVYPQAVAIVRGRVFIANGNLVGSVSAGPSWLSSFPCCGSASAIDSVPLTGANARVLLVGDDSLLYVVEAGHPGQRDGKLSVVDPVARTELAVINGLGESPSAAAFHRSGRILVAAGGEILEVNTLTRSVTRGPGHGVNPGLAVGPALAVDLRGRVYAAWSCQPPEFSAVGSYLNVLSPPPDYGVIKKITGSACPLAVALAVVP
ncbi:MAG TPA: hypothetical protein VIW28_07640 [Gemmatimonadales bacterium]